MLKLKRYSKGQWFDYPKADGVRLLIRPIQLSDGLAIRSKLRKGVMVEIPITEGKLKDQKIPMLMEDVDSAAFSWESFNHMLEDFEGITIEDEETGEVITDKAELRKAIFNEPELRDFIAEKSEFLKDQGGKKKEKELGNSKGSQSG